MPAVFCYKEFPGWVRIPNGEHVAIGDAYVYFGRTVPHDGDDHPDTTTQICTHGPGSIQQERGIYSTWHIYRKTKEYARRKLPIGSNFSKPLPLP